MDNKEGHILPSFGLAHELKSEGHEIVYISIVDNEGLIRRHGFQFFPVLEKVYPRGYNAGTQKPRKMYSNSAFDDRYSILYLIEGELEPFLRRHRPDLLVATCFLALECLVLYYKYKIRPVILTTYLRNPQVSLADSCLRMVMDMPGEIITSMVDLVQSLGIRLTSLRDFVKPLAEFPELILCPRILETEEPVANANIHYIGPSIRSENEPTENMNLPAPGDGKRIIYASLGSYSALYGESQCIEFYRKIVNVMRHPDLSRMFLILSVGHEFDVKSIGGTPENVYTAGWVPQLWILQRASLVVFQGGLGTIKESIYHGVPMIVFPFVNDQPRNAMLVERHGLGLQLKLDTATEEKLKAAILFVIDDGTIRTNLEKMKTLFRETESAGEGLRIIRELL